MHSKVLFLFLLFISATSYSQLQGQQRIDSLTEALKQHSSHEDKVSTLTELFNVQLYSEPALAKESAFEMLKLSKEKNYTKGLAQGYYCLGNYHYVYNSYDSATVYYDKAIIKAKTIENTTIVLNSLSNLSGLENNKGNYDRAIQISDSVARMYLLNKDYFRYGITIGEIGRSFYSKGDYKMATDSIIKALRVLDTISKEPFRKADLHIQLGNINYDQGNYDLAIENMEKAYTVYVETDDKVYQAYTLTDIGNTLVQMEELDKAISYYKKSKALGEEVNLDDNTANTLANIGMVYTKQGKYDLAINNLKKSIEINKTRNTLFNILSGMGELGHAYGEKGDHAQAINYLNQTVQLADSMQSMGQLQLALAYRSDVYQKAGQYKAALEDEQRRNQINDSLFSLEKTKEIEKLQIAFETEKKESAIALQEEEIKTLNEKSRADSLQKGLYAGGMASALALFGLSVFGYQQRIKKNRIAHEKQEEIYKQEIAHKQKELASQTLHLVQKNTFLDELKENLESLKNSPEKFKMEFRRIVMLLKKEKSSDKDWETFKTYFSEVHNDFDQKLKTLYPEISEKEIRLAAFLRMNLTTKEIAATMNVLPDSILKSKYRLKKKLGLDKETDLMDFLNTF
jgi:tetratricopeptide (TPR) repeat protein